MAPAGIPLDVYAAPPGPVELRHEGVRFLFLPVRGGRVGAALDGILPHRSSPARTSSTLSRAQTVHSIAREWSGPLERAARAAGAAFVETPLVHPGQRFSGSGAADIARYRRDDAVIALTKWEAEWYASTARATHARHRSRPDHRLAAGGADGSGHGALRRAQGAIQGYHALRDAAKIVWRSRPEARFVAIGQNAWTARFERRFNDDRWIDRGIVSEAEKAEAYARATIFAMPSIHETFGHTYLEAWYAWRPVIAGDIPALREVVRDGIDGLVVAQEPDAIARAILTLLGDTTRARRMGESGRFRLQEKWTWDLVAERTERAYEAARERAASR